MMRDLAQFRDFDHNEPEHRRGIEARWSEMRACPFLPHSEKHGGFHVVTRYDDVAAVTRQHKIYSSADGIAIPDIHAGTRLLPLESDPPVQGKYRRIVLPFLSRSAVIVHEQFIRALTRELIDGLHGQTACDFGRAFALPLPCRTMLHVLGLPGADAQKLDRLITMSIDGRGTVDAAQAGTDLHHYLGRFVDAQMEASPNPGSIASAVAHAMIDEDRITRSDAIALTKLLLFGGFTTATFVLTSAMRWLGDHPGDWQRLSDDRSLIPEAIEEFVRFASPGTYLGRTVTQETRLGSSSLCPGDKILVSYGAANHDPAIFEEPEQIHLDRNPTNHVGFGHGTHACIGLHLARLELRVAFEELTNAIASFRFDHDNPVTWSSGETQGMTSMTLGEIVWR